MGTKNRVGEVYYIKTYKGEESTSKAIYAKNAVFSVSGTNDYEKEIDTVINTIQESKKIK